MKWVPKPADRFPCRSWSVQIFACGEGTSCTPAYCSTGLKFSIFLFSDKAPLEQILTKNPMSLGKKSWETKQKSVAKIFSHPRGWIIVFQSTSQCLMDQRKNKNQLPFSISWRIFHPFIWSVWSQLLWEGCLVLFSVVDLILKSKHILPYAGRQKSAVACSEEWIMPYVSSSTFSW